MASGPPHTRSWPSPHCAEAVGEAAALVGDSGSGRAVGLVSPMVGSLDTQHLAGFPQPVRIG